MTRRSGASSVAKTPSIFAYTTIDSGGTQRAYSQRLVNCRAEASDSGVLENLSSLNTNFYIKGTEGIRRVLTDNEKINDEIILAIEPVFFYDQGNNRELLAIMTDKTLYLWDCEGVLIEIGSRISNNDLNSITDNTPHKRAYIASNGFTIVVTIPETGEGYIWTPVDLPATQQIDDVPEEQQRIFGAVTGNGNIDGDFKPKLELTDLRSCFENNENTSNVFFNTVTFVNGRYLLTLKDSPQFRWSGVFDDEDTGSRFPANWVATSEASPDPTLNILFDGQTLVMAGKYAIELWQNNVDEDPTRAFTRLPGGIINRGFVGADACCKLGNTIYGIQDDGTIWMVAGSRIRPVTTTTQAQILSSPYKPNLEGCGIEYANLYSYRDKGNDFLVAQTLMKTISVDDSGESQETGDMYSSTLVLDTSTGLYHTRVDGTASNNENNPSPVSAQGVWSIIDIKRACGKNYGIRQKNGESYLVEVSDCYNTDENNRIFRVARTNPIQWKNQRITQYEFELYTGFKKDSTEDINYRESLDGDEFSPAQTQPVNDNTGAENTGRVVFYNRGTFFGSARNRIIEISYSGRDPFIIFNSYVTDQSDKPGT